MADGVDKRNVYLTLLALYILEEEFEINQDEWMMIAKKAKDFLTKQVTGWSVPHQKVIQKFTIQVK